MREQTQQKTANNCSGIFRIYFFRSPNGGSLLDRVLAKGIKDYQRLFEFQSNVAHIAVQLEGTVYETTIAGTVSYEYTEALLSNPRLLSYWEYDLKLADMEDKIEYIRVALDRQVRNKQKLDIWGCLRYGWQFKTTEALVGFDDVAEDVNLREGTCCENNYILRFNLPFTCVTLASIALDIMFDMCNVPDGHLPAPLHLTCLAMDHNGIGDMVNYGITRLYFV